MRPKSPLLLAYYGDDFTGSTDVLEAIAHAGIRTRLFLEPPAPGQLGRFPDLQAFGIAGGSRMFSPEEMTERLPSAFHALHASGAPLLHYKICSTFDSSPTVGSIGKAIELGREVFGKHPTPLVVGAPTLGRYLVFGNLFARSGLDTEPFRLDRHPTMQRHPVTPMHESDLRLILAEQTSLPVHLITVLQLSSALPDFGPGTPPVVLFDTVESRDLMQVGEHVLGLAATHQPLFCVGSSGLEYALLAAWRERGELPAPPPAPTASQPTQILVVSGSCSPVTERQLDHALQNGYVEAPLNLDRFRDPTTESAERSRLLNEIRREAQAGNSPVVATRRGSSAPQIVLNGTTRTDFTRRMCQLLAEVVDTWLQTVDSRRVAVCGGDTSTEVARALGIESLEYLMPVAPGSPLCRVCAPGRPADGCEFVFKGGQVGRDGLFTDLFNLGRS